MAAPFSCHAIYFNDSGLGDDRNATFLYNLMTTLPSRARIGLAESHYYAFGSIDATNPLIHLLFKTPVGLGVTYIGLIIFLFLILRGKRFGKPLVVEETHSRFSSEYVLAMTALYQKGNTRSAILKQIRDTFRSDLSARWNINPSLNTASFVEEWLNGGRLIRTNSIGFWQGLSRMVTYPRHISSRSPNRLKPIVIGRNWTYTTNAALDGFYLDD